jgi:ribosomal protein S18 acetylase RimI-like enzyme
VVQFRTFRNDDPPGLAEVWNEAFTGRGSVPLRHSSPLERFAFSKPYFDPAGLTLALEGGKCVGLAHASFGPNASETALCPSAGITCVIGVRPAYRRRGIGSELLRRSESYLRARGARMLYAGPMRPLNPMYFGLYGGSDLPGFLESDDAAAPFLGARGYRPEATALVFQRPLDRPVSFADARLPGLRRRLEVQAVQRAGVDSWWRECTLGAVEMIEFRLVEAQSGKAVAAATAWEMEGYSWRWGLPAVGLVNVTVDAGLRRQGAAKYLLSSVLRYLQDQYFGVVEAQTVEPNPAAESLLRVLGFEMTDRGHVYRRQPSDASAEPMPERPPAPP